MNAKIAIIEDDPFTQHFYSQLMKRAGLQAFIMEDANLLLQKLDEEKIGLIIMDINLRNTYLDSEKIDGIQLSRHIKTQQKYSSIPVILVSAFTLAVDKNNILAESLAHHYITKPITDFKRFIQTINEAIVN